jgi:HEPN domain-containing protein
MLISNYDMVSLLIFGYNNPMTNRANDWYKQSLRDLEQAIDSKRGERHEWACFAAQQAAEKAEKALHLSLGQEGWGYVVARLLSELPDTVSIPDGMIDKGRVLDNIYIPTRHVNGHPEGAPFEHYGLLQSQEAISYASEIIDLIGLQMA